MMDVVQRCVCDRMEMIQSWQRSRRERTEPNRMWYRGKGADVVKEMTEERKDARTATNLMGTVTSK